MKILQRMTFLSFVALFLTLVSCAKENNTAGQSALLAAAAGETHTRSEKTGFADLSLNMPGAGDRSNSKFFGMSKSSRVVGDVTTATLEISAADMTNPLLVNLVQYDGAWGGMIGSIPAGSDRTFTARGYDADDHLIYEGTAMGVTILPGETASVYILLEDILPAEPFENSVPIIDAMALSSTTVVPEGEIQLAVTAHDDNEGDTITYEWSATGGTFDNTASLTPVWSAPSSPGTYTLTITVTDNPGSEATMSVNVMVDAAGSSNVTTEFNTYPVVTNVTADPSGIDVNESTNLNVIASDADNDTLSYLWSSDCGGSFSSTAVAAPVYTAPSSYPVDNRCTLTVEVSDGRGGSNTGRLNIHVRPPLEANLAPVITTAYQSTATAQTDETTTLFVEANDPELQPLGFTWSSSGGTLVNPVSTSNTAQVEFRAATAGIYTITVRVEDGGVLYTEYTFSVTVASKGSGYGCLE